jgi:hypothetical protein
VFCADAPIKVIVGSEKLTFHAHKAVLFKSAVLKSKYESEEGASEGATIILPDEDPVHFRKILHYLYYGTWCCSGWGEPHLCEEDFDHCTCFLPGNIMEFYFQAARYQLAKLKSAVLASFGPYVDVGMFLRIFKGAYEQCPGDVELRSFFKQHLATVWKNAIGNGGYFSHVESIAVCTNDGGEFVVDLATALASAFEGGTSRATQSERELRKGGVHRADDCDPDTCRICDEYRETKSVPNGGWENNHGCGNNQSWGGGQGWSPTDKPEEGNKFVVLDVGAGTKEATTQFVVADMGGGNWDAVGNRPRPPKKHQRQQHQSLRRLLMLCRQGWMLWRIL